MTTPLLPRLAAVCGALFAIVLFIAAGDGSQAYSSPRAIAGIAAITLAVPFLAYVSSLLRAAEGPDGWLASTALASGITGITIKLGSGASMLALHRAGIPAAGQIHAAIEQLGDAATVISLFPLAIFCAATAIVALRTRVLPVWLGIFAAITAVALAVNGGFVGTEAVPAMLMFTLWSLVASVYLIVRSSRSRVPAGVPVAA